jgi:hypothetical protein
MRERCINHSAHDVTQKKTSNAIPSTATSVMDTPSVHKVTAVVSHALQRAVAWGLRSWGLGGACGVGG